MDKKKIMVVDDEKHIVKLISNRLIANDYEVTPAYNGEQALEKLLQEKPDLIILDIMMPIMDGYSFIKEARARGILGDIPIIVLSGKEKMTNLMESEGISAFIVKPCTADDLLSKIKEHLVEKDS
ncbi:MAG: response regulator [bacterium]